MSDVPRAELDPRLDRPMDTDPTFRYVIFSQQRTGSRWLSSRLANLGCFGVPAEYLNPVLIPDICERIKYPVKIVDGDYRFNVKSYLRAIGRLRTSPSGRFGIVLQPNQIFPQFNDDLALVTSFLMDYDAVILLTRRDKVRQAVSAAISNITKRWIADKREPDLSGVDVEQLLCDTASILGRYVTEAKRIATIGRSARRPVLAMTYEEMVADPNGTLDQVVRFLGHKDGLASLSMRNLVRVPEAPSGRVNAEISALFLDYIAGRVSPDALMLATSHGG